MVKNKRSKATLYKGDPVLKMEAVDCTGSSISKLVNEKIGRYQQLLSSVDHGLTVDEVSYIKKIYETGRLTDGLDIIVSFLKDKNSQELVGLIQIIENMDLVKKYSLIEELERI